MEVNAVPMAVVSTARALEDPPDPPAQTQLVSGRGKYFFRATGLMPLPVWCYFTVVCKTFPLIKI